MGSKCVGRFDGRDKRSCYEGVEGPAPIIASKQSPVPSKQKRKKEAPPKERGDRPLLSFVRGVASEAMELTTL